MDMAIWLAASQTSFAVPLLTLHSVVSVQELWHYLWSSNLLVVTKSLKSARVSSGYRDICIAATFASAFQRAFDEINLLLQKPYSRGSNVIFMHRK